MTKWLSRGLVFAALMIVIRLIQGALINQFETSALLISLGLLAVFVVAVLVWGLLDGRADARANPDPDRRADLAMTWLLAGLVAGLLSGAAAWFISLFYKALYVGGLLSEITTFAAFTALMVFLPAILAVGAGRWSVDRNAPPVDRHGHAGGDDRADTDVFAAVRDETSALGGSGAEAERQDSAVALAERDDSPTEEHRKD